MNSSLELITFERPPITEVVCGIQFAPIAKFFHAHLGLLWERYRQDFPRCDEKPLLMPTVEQFDKTGAMDAIFKELPFSTRTWFVSKDQNHVIQLQRDRFLFNWRKQSESTNYPRFPTIFGQFSKYLETFRHFVNDEHLGNLNPLQYEMTYVNHISEKDGFTSLKQLGEFFPDLTWRQSKARFLPDPESFQQRYTFVLPNQEGRLHINLRSGVQVNGKPAVLLEITARGFPKDGNLEAWFKIAHEWIVKTFSDFTDSKIQKDKWSLK